MTMMNQQMLLPLTLLCLLLGSTASFTSVPRVHSRKSSTQLNVLDDGYGAWLGGHHSPSTDAKEQIDPLHKALQERKEQLSRGIGKRFVVKTQRGCLNVHSCMSLGPFATDNIVSKLSDGDIITSKNIIGSWIQHEQGWSIARFEGFVFLQPIDE